MIFFVLDVIEFLLVLDSDASDPCKKNVLRHPKEHYFAKVCITVRDLSNVDFISVLFLIFQVLDSTFYQELDWELPTVLRVTW